MARLSRKLRICKWVGTVGCVLIAVAFVASGWGSLSYTWASEEHAIGLLLSEHGLLTCHVSQSVFGGGSTGWSLSPAPDPRWRGYQRSWARLPSTIFSAPHDLYILDLPLWLPFLVLLIPTPLLWWRDWRKPPPGFCTCCGYDLTGNVTGACPECGEAIEGLRS
jgi:hypothetical protein